MDQLRSDNAALADTHGLAKLNGPATAEIRAIMGLRYWDTELGPAAQYLVKAAVARKTLQVYFVNAHCVNVAARDLGYAQLLQSAPFLFADGAGMALAARLNGAYAGTSDLVVSADDSALPEGAGRVVLRRWRGNRGGGRARAAAGFCCGSRIST